MKARPILMSTPMVRALLAGTKTQTRRIVKPQPNGAQLMVEEGKMWFDDGVTEEVCCPYGQPGDLLFVRESFSYEKLDVDRNGFMPPWFWADGNPLSGDFTKPKPSIHMPRWASRLTLKLSEVLVERLQDIGEGDAIAEGIESTEFWRNEHPPSICYSVLWNRINGRDSWNSNPFVWVLSFRVHHQNVDEFIKSKEAA